MNQIELKTKFHQLIDHIENEEVLMKFYQIMEKASDKKEGKLWERLSEIEKNELLLIEKESELETNLIPHSIVQEKHQKWL